MDYEKAFLGVKELLELMSCDEKLPQSPCDTPIMQDSGYICTWHRTVDFTKGQRHAISTILEFLNDLLLE